MFQRATELVRAKYAWWDDLTKAGIEPDQVVDTLVIGGEGELAAADHHTVVVAEGKLDGLVARLEQRGVRSARRSGIDVWTVGGYELAVIDHRLIVTAEGGIAAVLDRTHGKARGKGAAVARQVLAATSPGTDVFGGIVVDSSQRGQLAMVFDGEPLWIAVSLAAAAKLVLEVRIELPDEEAASKVRARLASRLLDPMLHDEMMQNIGKDFSDSLVIDQDRTRVSLTATFTADEADKLFSLAKLL
jgi:hypothetical protein